MKRFLSLILSAAMVFCTTANLTFTTTASAEDGATVVRLDPSNASPFNDGEFEGWGTALCWWANRLGYSPELTQQAATAFFSEEGLGLDIARYNLGGGDDPTHNHITRSDSKVPGVWKTFELSSDGKDVTNITYDITNDQNQLNIAKAALEANPNLYFEGFSNSAPYFMTVSGCTGGGDPAESDNLKADMYDDFARFIADGTKLFKDNGIVFKSYSPMNEPDTNYWGVLSPKQEGCHFTPGTSQSNMIIETRKALDTAGLTDVLVAGMDETSLKSTYNNLASLTTEAKAALGRVDTHTYSDRNYHAQVKARAQELDKNLWMSEVDKGGDGFTLAQMILEDMNGMQPSAWVMWDIVDKHRDANFTAPDGTHPEANATLNATDSLWGVGMGNHDTNTLELANKYYFFGQFTRYINPGDTIIASSSNTLAAYNKTTGDIKIVALNSGSSDRPYTFDLGAFTNVGTTVKEIRTNNATGSSAERWTDIENGATLAGKKLNTTLKAGTLTTYVVEGAGATDYMMINGASTMVVGVDYSYTVTRGSSATAPTVTWTVSDPEVADVTADGVVKAKKGGSFTLTATATDGAYTTLDIQALSTDQTIRIVNKNSGKGLETKNKALNSGAQLTQWEDRGIDTAAWKLSATSDGHFNIANANNNMLLANSNGTLVVSDSITGDNAKWDLINHGGYYEIKNVSLGKSLDVSGQSVANGGNVILYTFGGGDNELWSFVPTEGELTHVVIEPVDYSAKYTGTKYTYVSNYAAATNDFNDSDLKGFTTTGTGGATADGAGEAVLGVQSNYNNQNGVGLSGSATLTLDPALTCVDSQIINMAFDVYCSNSGGTADFGIYGTNDAQLMKVVVSGWDNYVINTGNVETDEAGNAKPYLRNNVNDKVANQLIANGGHMEIYYKPSTGIIKVTLKNNTNSSPLKSYEGRVKPGTPISKLAFNANYTSWSKPMYVDNLVTNIVTYSDDDFDDITAPELSDEPDTPPTPTEAPVLPSSGELINLNFNGNLDSTSTYGKATAWGTAQFATVDERQALQFDGTRATAIKLTDANGNPLLTGQKNLTISFKVKPTTTATSWWLYAAPNDNAQTVKQEKYLGAHTNSGKLNIERYNNSGARSAMTTGTVPANEWNDVEIHVNNGSTSVFVNGTLQSSVDSTVIIADMLGDKSVMYIGLANWGSGEYATGYMDDFVIKNYSLPTVQAYRSGDVIGYTSDYSEADGYDMFVAVRDNEKNLIGVSKGARGSFDLPDENGTYTITEYLWKNMEPVTDPITIEPETITDGYLFAHFVGTESSADMEQIYFSLSTDGSSWKTINSGAPILTSTVGEKGVRDPYIMRTEDGKFVIIATDLSIYNLGKTQGTNKWGYSQTNGSKNIVVWKSDDLVNWSNANLVKVALDTAGCTWAPEAVYDSEKQQYMVFWASKVSDDSYAKQRMYRSYTTDFETFTEPEIYIENDSSAIDTTIIKEGDTYYRFTKDETHSAVTMMKSTSLSEGWTDVDTYKINNVAGNTVTGYEGPTIYKINGEDKWCLLLDYYSKSQGYKPFVTDDISVGAFTSAADFKFDATYRHGTVMPITGEEYIRLLGAY